MSTPNRDLQDSKQLHPHSTKSGSQFGNKGSHVRNKLSFGGGAKVIGDTLNPSEVSSSAAWLDSPPGGEP